MRTLPAVVAATILAVVIQDRADGTARTELTSFNVTIRVFDPTKGYETGQDHVLPVDSPDA